MGEIGRTLKRRAIHLVPILFGAALVTALAVFPELRSLHRDSLREFAELGSQAPALFIVIYVLTTGLFLPATPLDVAAGAHFGFMRGVLWVQVAATCSAAVGFLLGRYFFHGLVERLQRKRPKLVRIDRAIAERGAWIVLLSRMTVFPFGVLNCFCGATHVSFFAYLRASFLGMLPGTVLNVYAGVVASDLAAAAGDGSSGAATWLVKGGAFAAMIVGAAIITRYARRRLNQEIAP